MIFKMNNLNFCFECNYRCKPRKPLPKSILKIHQANRQINPKLSKLLDQLINQRFKDYD